MSDLAATTEAVTTFGGNARGERQSSFKHGSLTVLVKPFGEKDNETAFACACELARHWRTVSDLEKTIAHRDREVTRLRALLPAFPKARLLGRGCVRFRDGALYLLNRRDQGWSSFAVMCDGWDDLFRRYNVAVVEYGTDAYGAWWEVENIKAEDR